MGLSKKHLGISESLTLAISARAKAMKAAGLDVIGFGAGEPDFNTPDFIIESAKEALDRGFTGYTSASGTKELKEAICGKLQKDNGLEYNIDQVIVSNGAKHSLYNTLQAILNPGDEVIIPVPYWVSYPELVKMGGGKPVYVETKEEYGFKMEIEELKKVVTPRTKALILNSPSNPTGTVYEKGELEAIVELAVEKGFFIISDEIYEKLIYDGVKHTSIASLGPEIKDLTIVINGMSKAYAMTGWRIGYAAGRKDIIKVMSNIQSHSTSNPNSIAQYASVTALTDPRAEEAIEMMVREFNQRRKYMAEKLNNVNGLSCLLPQGAFYVFLNIGGVIGKSYQNKEIDGSLAFADNLLEAEKVAVVPGVAFGADNFVRLSYATSMDNISRGLERIERFIGKLE
ncbi:MAG: aspartate aminotransferase [Halanaerobiales bacterium]|nr:aspartate aminotransferase [Halanaerobiales bacterium]